jgi:hypothetical protein
MTIDARESLPSPRHPRMPGRALRLPFAAMTVVAVLFQCWPGKPASSNSIDPYRKAESILGARGFAADISGPTLGLATRVVSYSSEECPQGVTLAVLSYDQLRIILDRMPPRSARSYLVVSPFWERTEIDRLDLFLAGMTCKMREPTGSTSSECDRYLYIAHRPACLHLQDWQGFWHAP